MAVPAPNDPTAPGRHMRSFFRLKPFSRDESGVTAVEFALALPVLLMMLVGIMQLGLLFFLQNNMSNAAREGARSLAIGAITQAEAENYVKQRLTNWNVNFTVTPDMPNPADPNDTDVTVTVSAPMSEAVIVDPFGFFQTGTVSTQVAMREQN